MKYTHLVIIDNPDSYEGPAVQWCGSLGEANEAFNRAMALVDADVTLCRIVAESTAISRRVSTSVDQ